MQMLKALLIAFLAGTLACAGGIASTADAAQPPIVTVQLANFSFTPAQLDLRANAPTVLQLRNNSGGGHNFSAPAFFAAARIDPASAALVRGGKIEIPGHSAVQVVLTPAA